MITRIDLSMTTTAINASLHVIYAFKLETKTLGILKILPGYNLAQRYLAYIKALLSTLSEHANWTIFVMPLVDNEFTIPSSEPYMIPYIPIKVRVAIASQISGKQSSYVVLNSANNVVEGLNTIPPSLILPVISFDTSFF